MPRVIEKDLNIRAKDGARIYGTIGLPAKRSRSIVLFVHGLASTSLWPTMVNASFFMRQHGLAYCRFDQYDWQPGARTLLTTDFRTQAEDTETVARHFLRNGFDEVFAVGHSFGGLTLLRTDSSLFSAMSLWDCSSFISFPFEKWVARDRSTGALYITGGCPLLLSKRFHRGAIQFKNELELASQITVPTMIAYANGPQGVLKEASRRYFKTLTVKEKLLFPVPRTSHSFTEERGAEPLHAATLRWFKKHSRLPR